MVNYLKTRNHWLLIPALMLLFAIGDLPYGYYQLLRWVVFGVILIFIALYYKTNLIWSIILGIIALVFNPIIPFRMARSEWLWIDIGSSIILGVNYLLMKTRKIEEKGV